MRGAATFLSGIQTLIFQMMLPSSVCFTWDAKRPTSNKHGPMDLLSTIPESGLTLQQLDPPAGRQREHIEFALSRFFNDEISMVIAGSRPDDDDEEQPF